MIALGWIVVAGAPASSQELYSEQPPARLLEAAKAVFAADPVGALVTVDAQGRPRVRSVEVHWRATDDGAAFELWIATRPSTRKVEQIATHPQVALYFEDDAGGSYLSVMGRATAHADEATVRQRSWHSEAQRLEFYPDFPRDMVLLRVRPTWLEVIAPEVEASDSTWRPQALVFDAEASPPGSP